MAETAALLEKKRRWGDEAGQPQDNVCQNPKCLCVHCTCGSACTCGVSMEVTCDPCKTFKSSLSKMTNEERLQEARSFWGDQGGSDRDIEASEVLRLRQEGQKILMVDCRTDVERAVSRIQGAPTLLDVLMAEQDTQDKDVLVVPYCSSGARSSQDTQTLIDTNSGRWNEVRNLKLGLIGWCHAGGALVDAEGHETKRVHAFAEVCMPMFPAGYEATCEPAV